LAETNRCKQIAFPVITLYFIFDNDMNAATTLHIIILLFSVIGGMISLIMGIILHKKIALFVAASFIILIGFTVILGYIFDAPNIYTYPSGKVGMALPTGICFLITGFCLVILINEIEFKKERIFKSPKKDSL
jgi:hypothetical protein